MENLFMQIFDRKRLIEDQFKYQVESYGESLASSLLSEGQCPPPWLLTFGSGNSICPDPRELNRKQLISEILDRHPRVTTPANNDTFFILPTLRYNNVNLFSNSVFTRPCASSKDFDIKAADELVSNDVPEGTKQNPETIVEAEVSGYSNLRQSTRSETLRSKPREIDTPPSKKAKTVNLPVRENTSHAFTGRVTRSMATKLNRDHALYDGNATRCRSAARKHRSIDRSSKLSKVQKDMLSVPSTSIENNSFNNSLANGLYLNATHTARNDCQISDSLSFRLSEITLLEPEHCLERIVGCNPDESTISSFDVEDHENTAEVPIHRPEAVDILAGQDSFTSMHLNENTLHGSGIVQTIKEVDRDTTDGPIEEMREMEDSKCDSHFSCHDWKISGMTNPLSSNDVTCQSPENAPSSSLLNTDGELNDFSGHFAELQVSGKKSVLGSLLQRTPEQRCRGDNIEFSEPGFDIFISNGPRDLNIDSLSSSITESQKNLETSLKKFNSTALEDEFSEPGFDIFISNGSRDLNMDSLSSSITESQKNLETSLKKLSSTALEDEFIPRGLIRDDTYRHRNIQKVHASNIVLEKEELETSSELLGEEISRRILDTALSKSSPEKDCMLNFSMDSSGHTHDLVDVSRKNSLMMPSTGEGKCCSNTKELLKDVALAKKSEGSYHVETIHLPLSIIDEFDSIENHVPDSGADNRVSDNGQDERCDMIGSNDREYDSHLPVSNVHTSIPSRSSCKENAVSHSSQDAGYMFNSGRGQNGSKERMSKIPMQYMEGEISTRERDNEMLGGSLQWAGSIQCEETVLHSSETNEMLKGTEGSDCSAKEMMQICISGPNLSPDVFRSRNEMLEGKMEAEQMGKVTPDAKKMCKAVQTRYLLRSSTGNNKHDSYDITWPQRKKMKSQSNSVLATSPRLRAKTGKHVEEHLDCIHRMSLDQISGSSVDFQRSMLSHATKVELSEATLGSHCEEETSNRKCRMMEGDQDIKGKCQAVRTPMSVEHANEEAYLDLADEDSSVITEPAVLNLERYHSLVGRQNGMDRFEHTSPTKFVRFENFTDIGQIHTGEGSLYLCDSAGLSQQRGSNPIGLEDGVPEFEGFTISVPPIIEDGVTPDESEISSLSKERASLLEQLCKSGSILGLDSCPLSKYNMQNIPDECHSLPADILERLSSIIDLDQFRISKAGMVTDPSCSLGSQFDGSLLGSQAYKLPSSNAKYAHEARKPFTPPFERLQQKTRSRKSVSSSEELVSNPELTCFRIDENSSTTEEPTSENGVRSRGVHMSKNRAALADVTSVYQNIPKSVSLSGKYLEMGSLDSDNIVPRLVIDCEENDNLSAYRSSVETAANSFSGRSSKPDVYRSSVETAANSFSGRSSKPDVSGNAINRNRSRTNSEELGKPSNIISSISSFIPLIQEKQKTVAPGLGKRDIKVKALEAAEAAKRLEEKRQYEREMKKAAAKLERARLEQENVGKLELKQKEKEESKKKKEAEFEARKRQRGVERVETERKKRCTEEARKQQRVHVERLQTEKAKKDLLDKNANAKKRKGRELAKNPKKHGQLAKVREVAAGRNTAEAVPHISRAPGDPTHETNRVEADGAVLKTIDSNKGVNDPSELQNAIQDRMSVTTQSRDLQSYDISPYRDSDDENGDEDHLRKKKYIPPWARRESLNQILLTNRHLNPAEVFSRKSSFSLNEVLLPKVQRLPLP